MLMCDEIITLVRPDGMHYKSEVVSGVSWYDKAVVALQDRGLAASRVTKIRIPADRLPKMLPKTGDLVVRGKGPDNISGLKDLDGYIYAKVMEVSDNRRGGLPHMALTCQ